MAKKFRLENVGDALFVYSIAQEKKDSDAPAIGIASLRIVKLSNGSVFIDGSFEVRSKCPAGDVDEVKKLLLAHII